ncbi:transcriptional regulator [Paractinoplanes deccanensis]|uniref:Transcriptional regulator n=1 Tax=Paractinoplanes deccanensis TaxID=113561 RepID=A0ABQ3Y6N9_9ACTN|nr:helix-turn-helix transcriptional regulator [Actinoplanes deccanensis]GID75649.1 transcriptional regulator [Actinoplanes deccanensis]
MTDVSGQSFVPSAAVGPKVAKASVAHRLRVLREQAGMSAATVAATMDWSVSKLTRIEKGEVTVQPLEVRALLAHYGVTDEDLLADFSRLARTSRTRQWYSRHRLNGAFADFVAYEHEAVAIRIWQVLFVPGLLQTREYARAITALTLRTDPNDEQVKARVDLRIDRQQAFFERLGGPDSPRLMSVIDEGVLRRPVGGRDVMLQQLDHLLSLAESTGAVELGVAPLDLERHSGLGGSFELLQFSAESHGDVLFVEAAAGHDFIRTDQESTARHGALFQDLLDYGRTGDRALQLIRSIRDEMRGS